MKYKPTNKILIAMPFWSGDKAQGMKLARLLADLEESHSKQADFLFVSRFDCKHDDATVKHVARKFNTHTYTSKKRGVGWPSGCNSIFFGGLEWIYHKSEAGQIPGYKAIFWMGADTAPLSRAWVSQLCVEWGRHNNIFAAGPMVPGSAQGRTHINGDAFMFSGELKFLRWLVRDIRDIKAPVGWDWALADQFERWGWADFSFIKSYWRYPVPFTQSEWEAHTQKGVTLIHGVKDDTLLDLARKNLLI